MLNNLFNISKIGPKAIWITASCLTVAALLLSHTFYLQSKKDIIHQYNTEQLILAKEASSKMEEFYSSLERTLKLSAMLIAEMGVETADSLFLSNLQNLYKPRQNVPLINISILGSEGLILGSHGVSPPSGETALRDVYEKALNIPPGEIYTTSLMNISGLGEAVRKAFFMALVVGGSAGAASSEQLRNGDKVIIFTVSLEKMLDKFIEPLTSGRNGRARVLDSEGTLLFLAKHPEMVFRNIFSKDERCFQCHINFNIETRMAAGQYGTGKSRVSGYEYNLVAYYPVRMGGMKWSIAVAAPYSEVSSAMNKLMKRNGLLTLLIILIFLGSTTLTGRYLRLAVKAEEEARHLKQEVALKTMLQKSDIEVVRLAAAIESMDTLVLLTDLQGEIFYINPAAEKCLGYSAQELISTEIERLYAPSNPPDSMDFILSESIKRGWEGECFILREDGAEIPVNLITSSVKSRDGEPISMTWSMRDLTETKELQNKLIQHEKMRALGVLAAGVAHIFNNILAAILGNTQLLLREIETGKVDPDKLKRRLERVEESAIRGAETVRRVVLYTRREGSNAWLNVSLNNIINQALNNTQSLLKEMHGVASAPIIEIETAFGDIPFIKGIYLELLEVFENILINAVEAMPEGGKITITTEQIGEYVTGSIADTGAGMDEEAQKQAFDPFFTTKGPQSSGLGLSTALGIILRHRGQIKTISETGVGTTFSITLPVSKDISGITRDGNSAGSSTDSNILILEDDNTLCNLHCSMLSSKGYQVSCFNGAQEGLDILSKNQFDLVLTELPNEDSGGDAGMVNLIDINKISLDVPIVVISSRFISLKEENRLKRNGIRHILTKPLESETLLRTLQTALLESRSD